jgi:hypothetical protein
MHHLRHLGAVGFGRRSAAAVVCAGLGLVSVAGCSASADIETSIESSGDALGTVYQVGPSRTYKTLASVASLVKPGDVVEVDGNAQYAGGVRFTRGGTPDQRITIRGIRVSGKRPVISGGVNTVELNGNYTTLEGFEVTGGSSRCIYHHAHSITVRDTVVRDCPSHGILGADTGSGSLTLDRVEVYRAGSGTTRHPIYIATDQNAYPGSVFRMQYCYIHDGNGGNHVKSRAERNEIYYNWIEGATYRELELIGPEAASYALKREDSDVVGNVFVKTSNFFAVRVGGDGTGDTGGRYRFMNNTFVMKPGSTAAIQAFDRLESLELHNNVFYREGGGAVELLRDEGKWVAGRRIVEGRNNWVPQGTSALAGLAGTISGTDPGFEDIAGRKLWPKSTSALIGKAVANPTSPSGFAFPRPLTAAAFVPPRRLLNGSLETRAAAVSLGAYEPYGAPASAPPASAPSSCATASAGAWKTQAFSRASGRVELEWTVVPEGAAQDGAVGLALGAATRWTELAAIVRFASNGVIDARDAGGYRAQQSVAWTSGREHRVRIVADVTSKRYSAFVTPAGGAEVAVARDFAFRTEQAQAAALDTAIVAQDGAASLRACGLVIR